jgi:hypothetical protein
MAASADAKGMSSRLSNRLDVRWLTMGGRSAT